MIDQLPRWRRLQTALLGGWTLYAFDAVSGLTFAVLGLAPSSPTWPLAMLLGGLLAIAAAALAILTSPLPVRQLAGTASGVASGAVLGFYTLWQLSGDQRAWAIAGAAVGGSGLGTVAAWAYGSRPVGPWRRFWGLAVAIASSLCSYGLSFGLSVWLFAALSTERWGLAAGLSLPVGLGLGVTQRGLVWTYRQGKKGARPTRKSA